MSDDFPANEMTFEVYKSPNPAIGESWIKIRGFEIITRKNPISNAQELEAIEKEIGLACMPEMLYGRLLVNIKTFKIDDLSCL